MEIQTKDQIKEIGAFMKYLMLPVVLAFPIMFLAGAYMGHLYKWLGFEWAIVIGILTIVLEIYIMKK